jgi:beta-glucosidase
MHTTSAHSPAVAQPRGARVSETAAAIAVVDRLAGPFRWGVATSAYQIEGAAAEDGRTASIWDTYCRVPGAVTNGDNGDIACEHYHRMPADVAMIAELGVDTYRFSVSWPRVQPGGRRPVNAAGMAFYDRLVDELLSKGVDPWLTLYHWDLPQELEDAGGWPARDTAERFADYSMLVFDALSDRVRAWTTLNEPWCSAMLGYAYGVHAPGRRDLGDGIAAAHHLLLGHGLATQRMRAAATMAGRDVELGITVNLGSAIPASDDPADYHAARRADGLGARIYLDPLLRGQYPADVVADLAEVGVQIPVCDGDLDVIATPTDVLGVNYYSDTVFSGRDEHGRDRDDDGGPIERRISRGLPRTAMGWEIRPAGLTDLLVRLPGRVTGNHRKWRGVRRRGRRDRLCPRCRSRRLPGDASRRRGRCTGGGRRRARLLRVVSDGQLRVEFRLRQTIRNRTGRLRLAAPDTKTERDLVARRDPPVASG